MNLARLSFRYAPGLLLTTLFLGLLGLVTVRGMPAAILPDFPFPRLVVIGEAGDLAIQDMLVRVTRPLEAAAGGVQGAKTVRSRTTRGAVELSIDFDWGSDMFEALTRLNAAVASVRSSLPTELALQVEWVNPSSFPVIGYSLTSPQHPPRELRELASLTIAPYLSRLEGIYRVLVQGGEVREYQVLLDPAALASAGIPPEQVAAALANTNKLEAVGRLTRRSQSTLVLATAQIERLDQIGDVVVGTGSRGAPVRVRDVARVREGDAEQQQVVTADGQQAVLLNILKQPGASTADVSREVAQALRELGPSLPSGIRIRAFYDEADLLHESMGSLRDSILVGAFLAVLVLLAFLRSGRSALIVLLCLPVTVLIAFLCLRLVHQTLNLMTLGGLAVGLGLIIDDVVVTLENVYRHLEMGKPPRQAALEGAAEIQKPMIGSTITTVAVFLPLAFLGGITGAFFAPLTITLTLLLVVSVALAVIIVPIICAHLLTARAPRAERFSHHGGTESTEAGEPRFGRAAASGGGRTPGEEGPPVGAPPVGALAQVNPEEGHPQGVPLHRSVSVRLSRYFRGDKAPSPSHPPDEERTSIRFYTKAARWCLAHPGVVLAVVGLMAVAAVGTFRTLPTGFMPEMDEGAFVLDYLAPAGTSLADTDRQVRVIEAELRATPEIASYSRRTGLEMGFFVTDPNRGDIMIKLAPRAARERSMAEVMEDVLHRCEARLPGMTIETVAPLADRVADIAGEPSPIEVKFFGDDPKVLARLAGQASEIVAHVRGTTESIHELTRSGPELTVRIDPARAGRLGLTPQDVIQTLGAELFGRTETFALSGERMIPIRVVLPRPQRRTVDQLRGLPILAPGLAGGSAGGSAAGAGNPGPARRPVPLEAIADLSEEPGAYEVARENQKMVVPVTAGLQGRDLGSANAEVRRRIEREIHLPPGYIVSYGGIYQTQQESFRSLLTVLLLGIFLVFIVMVFQYGRLAEPVALILSGVLALVGVVAALRLTGTPFNASSFTGAIMIFGMVLTNGIVLMDMIRAARRAPGVGQPAPTLPEAILHAGALRVRPVLMTASIAVLTLLPLALGIGSGAEMQRPLAVAVIGGLAASPFFTLLVAPTFLRLLDRGGDAPADVPALVSASHDEHAS